MEPLLLDTVFSFMVLIGYTAVFFGGAFSIFIITRFLLERRKEGDLSEYSLLKGIDFLLFGVVLANIGHFGHSLQHYLEGQSLSGVGPEGLGMGDWLTAVGHVFLALAVINFTVLVGAFSGDGKVCKDEV